MKYKWNLAESTFSLWDRLKICSFFLNFKNRWTQDKYIKQLEVKAAKFVGSKYCVAVSSGSTANQLIAQYIKDELVKSGEWETRKQVILGAISWQTNASVFVREGFEPVFLDVNLEDFSVDYTKLTNYLKKNHNKVAAVFPTSVLGFTCDINTLKNLEQKYPKIKFALDSCENFFGRYYHTQGGVSKGICGFFTSSTSGFVAHHINSGGEFGLIFTDSQKEYEYFLLARAHGLRRNLLSYYNLDFMPDMDQYTNNLVDEQFDFQLLSSNYRSTDIMGFLCLLDSNKWGKNRDKRDYLYNLFDLNLSKDKFLLPTPHNRSQARDCAFCLPLICKTPELLEKVKVILDQQGIERRSFISGNMLRQAPYQKYGKYKNLKNAEFLNNQAIYIGLHTKVTAKDIISLCKQLNEL